MFSGYRRYRLNGDIRNDTLLLEGAYAPWYDREFTSVCNGNYSDNAFTLEEVCAEHLLAGICACGIYVLKQPNYIAGYREWPVLAEVSAWGAYIEFQSGWRVQHARIEHIWLDDAFYADDVEELADRYKVRIDILGKACLFCQQDHEYAVWPASGGAISICKMATSHILNALNYLQKTARRDASAAKWKSIFEKELKRRAPKLENGKMLVTL